MTLLKFSKDRLLPTLAEPLEEVTLAEWRENPTGFTGATALVLDNDVALSDVAQDLSGFSVIILLFPSFADGRAFSQARVLRERYGYSGKIRARGDVQRDQIAFMVRCGFDAFEFAGEDVAGANDALSEFSLAYQGAADDTAPVWRRRLSRAAAA